MEDKGEKKFHMRWAESRGPEVMQPARRGLRAETAAFCAGRGTEGEMRCGIRRIRAFD